MEFWGHEVKPGVTVSCEAGEGFVIHLSQAALGETKKGSENVIVFVKVGDQKLVIGTLSADKHPQISCDLIFDDAFELSHNSKTSTVFLCGYKSVVPDMFESDSGEDEDADMEADATPWPVKNNLTDKSTAKVSAKDLPDSDSEDSMSQDDSTDEDDISSGTDDSEDDSEDEETPVPVVGKKRAASIAEKIPASDKKAKISTPNVIDDKKGVHVATPHPAKQATKTPTDGKLKKAPKTPADSKPKEKVPKTLADGKAKTPADGKTKEKSPKSASHSCKSCSKTFSSPGALESHHKAKKHGV